MHDITLVGNNLAMLVAASELARRGRRVTLFSDGRPLGAHFAGITVQGLDFDIGMVMLEQVRSATPCADLRQYRSGVRNDWTRFGHLAAGWMESHQALRRVPTPECRVLGRVVPDYLIANRLDVFAHAPIPGPDAVALHDPRHPAHKVQGAAYDTLSYAQAAELNHGGPLHARYIEPFVRKLMGVGSADFLARYHRAAWAPLFFPETLRAALLGQPTGLTEYPFWMPRSGFAGQLVRDLREVLQATAGVTLRHEALTALAPVGSGLQLTLDGGTTVSAGSVALGLPTDRCHALMGLKLAPPGPAASVCVAFARVRADAIGRATGCQMVVDEDHASYRLTDQDTLAGIDCAWHRVTVEAGPDRLARQHPGLSAEDALALELRSLLQVDDPAAVQMLKCITARNALTLPTEPAVTTFDATHNRLEAALPGIALTGNLLGYGVASLNDQLVQGLKIAEELT